MNKRANGRKRRSQRGSALPAILALTIGVGALTTGYVMRTLREHGREAFDRDNAMSLYDAWSQMEVVARMVNASGYDASGRNQVMEAALARTDGQFIDTDGWPTNVTVAPQGTAGSGFFDIISTARVGTATTRVSALVRERQSFADFNYFVNSHPLGISGGQSATWPYSDAPEGSIHSNDKLVFYFPDRHFRDAVTAVNGFEFTAGAVGPSDPSDPQNNWFHGPVNERGNAINGLTDVNITGFVSRTDNLLSLTGDYDFAKAKLKGTEALVEHWQSAHAEEQDVMVWQEQFHQETRQRTVDDYGYAPMQVPVVTPIYEYYDVPVYTTIWHNDLVTAAYTTTATVPVYTQQLVTPARTETRTGTRTVYDTVIITPARVETRTGTRQVQQQVWIAGGGGGDTGGSGGTGGVGYWETQWVTETYTYTVNIPAVTQQVPRVETYTYTVNIPAVYQQVQTGTTTQTTNHPAVYNTWSERVQTGTRQRRRTIGYNTTYVTQQVWQVIGNHTEDYTVSVSDGWIQVPQRMWVNIPEHKVADHTLATDGTVYVKGDLFFVPMTAGADTYDVQTLNGSMTFASDSSVYLQDTMVYGKPDSSSVLQTAYLNGSDRTQPYTPNPDYRGTSVLGLIADQDIVYTSHLPTQAEVNATLLAKNGEVRVEGVSVASDGTVNQENGGWVKMSLRRLGGMTTNQRPVSSYVDSNNAVTRGFVYAKSIYDVRQRTTPPRGFPTLNRPRVLATILKEVK